MKTYVDPQKLIASSTDLHEACQMSYDFLTLLAQQCRSNPQTARLLAKADEEAFIHCLEKARLKCASVLFKIDKVPSRASLYRN